MNQPTTSSNIKNGYTKPHTQFNFQWTTLCLGFKWKKIPFWFHFPFFFFFWLDVLASLCTVLLVKYFKFDVLPINSNEGFLLHSVVLDHELTKSVRISFFLSSESQNREAVFQLFPATTDNFGLCLNQLINHFSVSRKK